jgi:hypothetical protein
MGCCRSKPYEQVPEPEPTPLQLEWQHVSRLQKRSDVPGGVRVVMFPSEWFLAYQRYCKGQTHDFPQPIDFDSLRTADGAIRAGLQTPKDYFVVSWVTAEFLFERYETNGEPIERKWPNIYLPPYTPNQTITRKQSKLLNKAALLSNQPIHCNMKWVNETLDLSKHGAFNEEHALTVNLDAKQLKFWFTRQPCQQFIDKFKAKCVKEAFPKRMMNWMYENYDPATFWKQFFTFKYKHRQDMLRFIAHRFDASCQNNYPLRKAVEKCFVPEVSWLLEREEVDGANRKAWEIAIGAEKTAGSKRILSMLNDWQPAGPSEPPAYEATLDYD